MPFTGSESAALPPLHQDRWPHARGHQGRTVTWTTTFSSSQTDPGSADASACQRTTTTRTKSSTGQNAIWNLLRAPVGYGMLVLVPGKVPVARLEGGKKTQGFELLGL